MRFSRRIPFPVRATILALMLLPSAAPSHTPIASQTQDTESPTPTAAEVWNEAAGALAAKILEHVTSGNTLALTVTNISSLSDDDVVQVRRALRTQLRSQRARLASKQANFDVQVTLSDNAEGYLWIAEIRDQSPPSAAGEDAAARNPVVMVPVARTSVDERHPTAEPLSIRKTRVYQQSAPMLDLALLDNPPVGSAGSQVSATAAARILVLGLDSLSLYEQAETPETGDKKVQKWRPMQSVPITRLRPWPRDPRGRIMVRPDSLFDVYLPGTKCTGALEPVLTLECHESDEPWPLVAGVREGNSANSGTSADGGAGAGTGTGAGTGAGIGPSAEILPAAYFTADRNFFDGRVKLDDGHEMKLPSFLAAVAMPRNGATHAGLKPGATGAPGWVLSGLDGRAQLLNSNCGTGGERGRLGQPDRRPPNRL